MKPLTLPVLLLSAALAGPALAHPLGVPETGAALVAASIQIDGRPVSLFPAPDGSGRYYLEARAGSRYAVTLANRTGERVGVVLTVDGLNAISGERERQTDDDSEADDGSADSATPIAHAEIVAGERDGLCEERAFKNMCMCNIHMFTCHIYTNIYCVCIHAGKIETRCHAFAHFLCVYV